MVEFMSSEIPSLHLIPESSDACFSDKCSANLFRLYGSPHKGHLLSRNKCATKK